MYPQKTGIILIVDDNPANLSVLSKVLKSSGLKVRVATDGKSAIEQVQYDPPDLILLDVKMPGIDGFQTCQCLKSNLNTQDIPVIFMTALADTEYKVKGLSLGAVDYITKPFQEVEVLARVRVHLQLRFLTQQVMEQSTALRQANQELQRLAHLDGLTELANRRRFDEYLHDQWQRLQREKAPLSLILCDVDYFKSYNDYYGHQAGDDCLKQVANALKNCFKRPADLVSRYGGEEFAAILPNIGLKEAIRVAQLIQSSVQNLQLVHCQSSISKNVTVSLGISSQIPNPDWSVNLLINGADAALYEAKKLGRNRYCYQQEKTYLAG
jgi:diguanylate cyclase (GGDEF)-like protein